MLQDSLFPSTSTTSSTSIPLDEDSNHFHHHNNYLPTPPPVPVNTIPHADIETNSVLIEYPVKGIWKPSDWGPVSNK